MSSPFILWDIHVSVILIINFPDTYTVFVHIKERMVTLQATVLIYLEKSLYQCIYSV